MAFLNSVKMGLYKIGIIGMSQILEDVKEDELHYMYVLADNVSDIEKWINKAWGEEYGLCLNFVEYLQNMEEHNASEV
jgi:hypothetical protein